MPRIKRQPPTKNHQGNHEQTLEAQEVLELDEADEEGEENELETDVDLNEGFEIDSLLVRRPQGRPKGVLDYKLPVNPIEGEYKKAVIVSALTHLYYMQERQFAPDNVSLHHFQKLLNISRHTVYRCLDDVKEGKVLAHKLYAELMVMSENLLQAERNMRRRQITKRHESQTRIMERRKLERRLTRASKDGQAKPAKQPAKPRSADLSE